MSANAITDGIRKAGIEELEQIISLAQTELEERRRKRREQAMAEIRRIAGAEHIPVRFDARSKPKKATRAPSYEAGKLYRHPSNPELSWNAKGQKPNWLRELEGAGLRAVEGAPANDNVPAALKKTG